MKSHPLDMAISSAIKYTKTNSKNGYWLDVFDKVSKDNDSLCQISMLSGRKIGSTIEFLEK